MGEHCTDWGASSVVLHATILGAAHGKSNHRNLKQRKNETVTLRNAQSIKLWQYMLSLVRRSRTGTDWRLRKPHRCCHSRVSWRWLNRGCFQRGNHHSGLHTKSKEYQTVRDTMRRECSGRTAAISFNNSSANFSMPASFDSMPLTSTGPSLLGQTQNNHCAEDVQCAKSLTRS